MNESIASRIIEHYTSFDEGSRLEAAFGLLEEERTRELIQRHLPRRPCDVVDGGGTSGPYAFWLAGLGRTVRLIDLVPQHIDRARARQASERRTLTSIMVGDARALDLPDGSADLFVLRGPLYHLPDHDDRVLALRECARASVRGDRACVRS